MKKVLSTICCVMVFATVLMALTACGSFIQDEWKKVVLGEHLPVPQEGKLRCGSNMDTLFMGGIEKVKEDYYFEYKNACIEMGYTIEGTDSGSSYDAYNADGYKLSLSYYSNQIHITLNAPVELSEIEWPAEGIGAKLPVPVSLLGKITADTSKSFQVTVGNITKDDYSAYVKACEEAGFAVDYTKDNNWYNAKDNEGYRLDIRYVGFNQIEITIQTPKQETVVPDNNTGNNNTSGEIGKEFKEAMDSYEQFMDKYVAFMKKYLANPSDMSLLNDYANYISQYGEFVANFEKWEGKDLNAAETAYYLEVQARVSKKLLEVAQ